MKVIQDNSKLVVRMASLDFQQQKNPMYQKKHHQRLMIILHLDLV